MEPTLEPMVSEPSAAPASEPLLTRFAARRGVGLSAFHDTYRPLARTIEEHVLPRLRAAKVPPQAPGLSPVSTAVAELADLALGPDRDAVHHRVADTLQRQTYEQVCLDLLAPAARLLGEMWAEDYCSFVDVSVGLLRLQEALHVEPPDGPAHTAPALLRRRLLVTSMPGEQHIFGATMVASLFRRAGWDVSLPLGATAGEVLAMLRRERVDIFALSIGTTAHFAKAAEFIACARTASRSPAIQVMVGGPAALEDIAGAGRIGADLVATDGANATWQAENLVAARGRPA